VIADDQARLEDDMTVPDPTGQPDIERPIDITDVPGTDKPGPAPTPEHHLDEEGMPGEDTGTPGPGLPARE
jgi:hypothetical protein